MISSQTFRKHLIGQRDKLFEILRQRCSKDEDLHLLHLIELLHKESIIEINGELYLMKYGISQGSVLSPLLFNVYLDSFLKSHPRLQQLLDCGDIKAFADDLVIHLQSQAVVATFLQDFNRNSEEWGIIINQSKSSILVKGAIKDKEIAGIKCVESVKYLGMRISCSKKQIIEMAKTDTKRYIKPLKYRLRHCNNDIKEYLMQCYSQSLTIYLMTPLLSAQAIKQADIDKLESQNFSLINKAPRSVSNSSITSLAQRKTPASVICDKIAKNLIGSEGQKQILNFITTKPTLTRRDFQCKKSIGVEKSYIYKSSSPNLSLRSRVERRFSISKIKITAFCIQRSCLFITSTPAATSKISPNSTHLFKSLNEDTTSMIGRKTKLQREYSRLATLNQTKIITKQREYHKLCKSLPSSRPCNGRDTLNSLEHV